MAGQELWRKINDPREVDPEDPEQNPPPAPLRPTAQDDPDGPNAGAGATAASAATPDYLAELTTKAEAVKRLAIAKKKDDARAFGDWIDHQFSAYGDRVTTAYGEWAEVYEQWQKQRPRHGGDGPPPPDKPLQLDRIPTSELKAAYDKEVEGSYDWIVPAFQEWAAPSPDVFTGHIAAMRGVEGRLGDGEGAPARGQRADQSPAPPSGSRQGRSGTGSAPCCQPAIARAGPGSGSDPAFSVVTFGLY
jgi:hypothetical protein